MKWIHRLTNKNIFTRRADCSECGKNIKIVKNGDNWKCQVSHGKSVIESKRRYRKRLSAVKRCSKCNYYNIDFRFFDVHHIDSNHNNNDQDNLCVLCPNCHRLETLKLWDTYKS